MTDLEELKRLPDRPYYLRALAALQEAHDACFQHPDRDVLGMSNDPFSGVNVALGIVDELEQENRRLIARVERAEKERDELSWRLSMALRQWRMYAELEDRELMVEDSTEAALYRSCSAALTGDTPNV